MISTYLKSHRLILLFILFFSINVFGQDQPWPGLNVGTVGCPATPSVSGNTTGANSDCGVSSAGDHMYQFTLAQPMNITLDVCGASWDTQLHLFNLANGNCNAGAIATNDDGCGLQSTISMTCLAAGTYVIVVEGFGSNEGAYTLNVTTSNCAGCAPSPADVPFPGLSLGTLSCPATTTVSDNTTNANIDCGISSSGDHIYQFTLAQAMDITLDVCGASWDTEIHLFNLANGNCNAGVIASNDDGCGVQSTITESCLGAGTYVVVVEGFGSNTGAYSLNLTTSNCGCLPPPPSAQDCSGGVTVCNSQAFSGNSSGFGSTQELTLTNSGCLSIEHQSSWYFFEASAAGQIAFTISPANGTDDYDFAVWGPYPTGSTPLTICPPTVAPLRCSYAFLGGNTGLLNGAGDNTEGAGGDRFVEDINANVGDVFILVVDNFSASLSPFDLNWNLTGGASLDCTPLPVILTDFYGNTESGFNSLHWVTENEVNNNFFRIQRSENGIDFYDIGTVSGAGNSVTTLEYSFNDYEVNNDYYYRLKQVDFNGKYELSNTIFIKNKIINDVNIFPNPSNENLFISLNNSTTDEFIWIIYTDVIGKSRHKELVSIQDGVNSYKLNLFSNLNSGIYFVQAIRENKEVIKTTKIIKE